MKVEESIYKDQYFKKITIEIGYLYFFERFIVSEINEGAHYDWAIAKKIIALAYHHYGDDIKVAYIANRINSYTVNPQDWLNFYKERHHLEAIAIVSYTKLGMMNVVLEKIFTQTKFRKFNGLEKAVNWVLSLEDNRSLIVTEKVEK